VLSSDSIGRSSVLHLEHVTVFPGDLQMPFEQWRGLPEYVAEYLLTMGKLHAANCSDRLTHYVEAITARPATSVRDFVARNAASFAPRKEEHRMGKVDIGTGSLRSFLIHYPKIPKLPKSQ
jgi:hypothetical protein